MVWRAPTRRAHGRFRVEGGRLPLSSWLLPLLELVRLLLMRLLLSALRCEAQAQGADAAEVEEGGACRLRCSSWLLPCSWCGFSCCGCCCFLLLVAAAAAASCASATSAATRCDRWCGVRCCGRQLMRACVVLKLKPLSLVSTHAQCAASLRGANESGLRRSACNELHKVSRASPTVMQPARTAAAAIARADEQSREQKRMVEMNRVVCEFPFGANLKKS
jgi:hypothetical protein